MAICRFTFSSGHRAIRSSGKFLLDGGGDLSVFRLGYQMMLQKQAGRGGTTPMTPPGSTPEPVLVLRN